MSSHHSDNGVARARTRRAFRTAVAVALVGGVVASGGTPAVAAPERVLQSVAITLGSDSSITGVSTTAVRAGEDDALSSDSATMDPAAAAEELPVRVLTSWRLGERTGTDLADIEGEEGRVVIDVTVQNVTARPEVISYDVNGTQRQQNALVAAPMTVVASADLGEDSLGTVVTRDDVNPEDVTNGVLGRSGEQAADVQWASLLAPPRLGASATFRLVQDTEKFTAPTFDLSVQPGLVTDPSVQRLLETAFSDDPSSTLALETSTIELVSGVNGILTGASSVLGQIQSELGASAADLGRQTIADLESSSALVSTSLTSLSRDLDALSGQMSQEMETANAETVAQFRDTVDSMKTLLGDPKAFDRAPTVQRATCDEGLPRLDGEGSITSQMIAITERLRAISAATDDCKEQIQESLRSAVGDPDTAAAGDGTVIGAVLQTQETLDNQAGALRLKGQEIAGIFDSGLLAGASEGVATLQAGMFGEPDDSRDGLYGLTNRLRGGNSDLQTELEGIVADIDELLAPEGLPQLSGELDAIDADTRDALELLSDDDNVSALQKVDALRMKVCSEDDPDVLDEGSDQLSTDLVGLGCGIALDGEEDAAEVVDDLRDRILASGTRITDAAGLLTGVLSQVDAVDGSLTDLERDLEEIRRSVFALQDAPARDLIAELQELMPSISEGEVTDRDCAHIADPDRVFDPELTLEEQRTDSVELIVCNYGSLYQNQQGIDDEEIQSLFDVSADELVGLKDDLGDDVAGIDRARREAEQEVDEVVGTLTAALDQSATSIRAGGKKSIAGQRAALDRSQAELGRSLDQRVAEAVRRIDATVGDSTGNLRASERALLADLDEVLLDLGTRDESGSGLLGALSKGAADTGTATDSVIRANQATAEFAGVRSTALADVFLQQAQLERSLELLESYPAFGEDGEDSADGSTHLTVFSFSMGVS